uniref:hypothetical protein n=1 Tax=Phenylobacterium sp. TaxID=1871053 RepID=UPI00286C808A
AGLVAFWDDEAALDAFLATAPLAQRLAGGSMVRLTPLRVSGAFDYALRSGPAFRNLARLVSRHPEDSHA